MLSKFFWVNWVREQDFSHFKHTEIRKLLFYIRIKSKKGANFDGVSFRTFFFFLIFHNLKIYEFLKLYPD